ncbi:MAG: hypothetical protein P1P87_10555, partial [Trueperaceae bacterium]|nr:hypothetical protein [Trueperaceae bacterium]
MDPATPLADAHPPAEIAHLVERQGVAKARLDALTVLVLAVLAGAFVALGFEHVVANWFLLPYGAALGGLG